MTMIEEGPHQMIVIYRLPAACELVKMSYFPACVSDELRIQTCRKVLHYFSAGTVCAEFLKSKCVMEKDDFEPSTR